ncbi:hypothetical protein LX36DRAFT_338753 [Colletotrichum falcatum]|nr:hypothetical protein LX36DRAFT_338753 [Colletotrichum falcatum]
MPVSHRAMATGIGIRVSGQVGKGAVWMCLVINWVQASHQWETWMQGVLGMHVASRPVSSSINVRHTVPLTQSL